MCKLQVAAVLLPLLIFSRAQATQVAEADMIDAINKVALNDRWDLIFSPDTTDYRLTTKKKYLIVVERPQAPPGGNIAQSEEISIAFKVYHYESESALREAGRLKQAELDRLRQLGKDIPQEGLLNVETIFHPRNGADQVLVNQIEVLEYFNRWYPSYHYKDDVYVAVDKYKVSPGEQDDTAAKEAIREYDKVMSLWTSIP
jgi:hypothetical protein